MSEKLQQEDRKWLGWWSLWLLTYLVSLGPPLLHHFRGVSEVLEPFRYAWGLMPADLLFLRRLGEISLWIPVGLAGVLVLAIRKPEFRRSLIATGACAAAAFSAVYACYCLLIVTTYLRSYSNAMAGKSDLLQAYYVKPPKAQSSDGAAPAKPAD